MAAPTSTRQWVLAKKPTDMPDEHTFKLEEQPLSELKEDQVLLKTLYLSNDPAQRGWIQEGMDPERLYLPPISVGEVMGAFGVASVIESKASALPKGTLVVGTLGWTEYKVADANGLRAVPKIGGLSETHFLGALGATGITAYHGLQVVRTGAEDTVVVSGAAGATGSMVVQIAKHLLGCKKVIGIAGSDDKCRWVESLGADICINYKSSNFKEELKKATEGFVEVYFDNVGGDILELMLSRIKRHGRIAACGEISNYNNSSDRAGLKNWFEIISNRLEVRGFIVLDANFPEITQKLVQAYTEGKIKVGADNETIVPTAFKDVPNTWLSLFSGANTGKLVTQIA